jgi:hypothetical protein
MEEALSTNLSAVVADGNVQDNILRTYSLYHKDYFPYTIECTVLKYNSYSYNTKVFFYQKPFP